MRFAVLPVTFLSALLGVFPLPSQAVDLGEEAVYSFLNEPFLAEVELEDWRGVGLENIRVELATQEEFDSFNLPWLPELTELEFGLEESTGGRAYVQITGRNPLAEPYLNFLLKVSWPGGSQMREYVVLLDIPERLAVTPAREGNPASQTGTAASSNERPSTSRIQEAVEQAPPDPRPVPAPRNADSAEREPAVPAEEQSEQVSTTPAESEALDGGQLGVSPEEDAGFDIPPAQVQTTTTLTTTTSEYRVQPGDSLWEIAARNRSGDLSIHQVMMALYEKNPHAFINRNITLLKANQVLAIPTALDMATLTPDQAGDLYNRLANNGYARVDALNTGSEFPEVLNPLPVLVEETRARIPDEENFLAEQRRRFAYEEPPVVEQDGLTTPFSNQSELPLVNMGEEEGEGRIDALEDRLEEREADIGQLEQDIGDLARQLREAEENMQRLAETMELQRLAEEALTRAAALADRVDTVTTTQTTTTPAPGSPVDTTRTAGGFSDSMWPKLALGALALLLVLSVGMLWQQRRNQRGDWEELDDMEIPDDYDLSADVGLTEQELSTIESQASDEHEQQIPPAGQAEPDTHDPEEAGSTDVAEVVPEEQYEILVAPVHSEEEVTEAQEPKERFDVEEDFDLMAAGERLDRFMWENEGLPGAHGPDKGDDEPEKDEPERG